MAMPGNRSIFNNVAITITHTTKGEIVTHKHANSGDLSASEDRPSRPNAKILNTAANAPVSPNAAMWGRSTKQKLMKPPKKRTALAKNRASHNNGLKTFKVRMMVSGKGLQRSKDRAHGGW